MAFWRKRQGPKTRKFLFDIGHPAHVHLFRNLIAYLKENELPYVVTSRQKDLTGQLLDHYGIPHRVLSKQRHSLPGQAIEFLLRTARIYFLHRKYRFTHALGTSVSIGYLSLFTAGHVKSLNFSEDDDDVIPIQAFLSYPFSTWIVNPTSIRHRRWTSKRILLPTYHELAYLHPNHFSPDLKILQKYNLEKQGFLIMRLSSLKAHHDRNEAGISTNLASEIRDVAGPIIVIESRETLNGQRIDPWDMHHLLAFARVLVSDSQTMTIEAALLGTPSIRISTFKDRLSCLDEIEAALDYTSSFFPNQTDDILEAIENILENDASPNDLQQIRYRFLESKLDLTNWMVNRIVREN